MWLSQNDDAQDSATLSFVCTRSILRMTSVLFVAALLLLAGTATQAEVITLSWVPSTTNTDDSPYTNPDGYMLYYSATQGGPYTLFQRVYNTSETSKPIDNAIGGSEGPIPDGTYYWVITSRTTEAVESAYSTEISRTFGAVVPPNPPQFITNGNLVAYTVQIADDVYLTYPVGTVAAGVECDANSSANGFHRIPKAAVAFAGAADAHVTFAECGQL